MVGDKISSSGGWVVRFVVHGFGWRQKGVIIGILMEFINDRGFKEFSSLT